LVDRSTPELRRAWRRLYHSGPPLGLSRDLIIRGLADQLQQRAHGGPQPRLAAPPSDFGGRVREGRWFCRRRRRAEDRRVLGAAVARTHHTVLVGEDGFEYDGQRYRSLTVIAERITGAHWSGPRSLASTSERVLPHAAPNGKSQQPQTRRNRTVRCAIYTRKSSEEGLEQEFNSLQAQREACEAFIESQRQEGWLACARLMMTAGSPARRWIGRLCSSCWLTSRGRVDTIVVYKIDRLTRSLADFCQDRRDPRYQGCLLRSVTQQFNTTPRWGA